MRIVTAMATTQEPRLFERLAWTALLGVATGLASIGAARLVAGLWRTVRHEEPPRRIGLMGGVAQKAGERLFGAR